jgi:hypothetical protein
MTRFFFMGTSIPHEDAVPLETLAEISATVTSLEPVRSFDAYVNDLSTDRSFQPALSTRYRDAFDAPTTYHGYRVLLDGVDVVPWIVGGVEHRQEGYLGEEELSFTLAGRQWALWATELTSTMLAPVVFEAEHGRSKPERVADAPVRFRIVQADQREGDGHHVLVDVVCMDELSARARTAELCDAVPPLSGRTVGSILGSWCDGLAMPHALPDGRTFLGRIQETGTDFLDRWRALAETEGWYPRTPDGVVRVATMEPRPADEPPDWELNRSRWNAGSHLDSGAPSEVPFRYVLRGETSVETEDGGVEIIRETIEERGLFAPEYALERQVGGLDNPATVPTGASPPVAVDRIISRLVIERRLRNGRPELETVTEWGWHWTEAALARYEPTGNKLTYIAGRYVDPGGLGRLNSSQYFVEIRKTTTVWAYGSEGEELVKTVRVYEEIKRDKPVLNPANPSAYLDSGYLYGDGRSYADSRALRRLAETIAYRTSYGSSGRKTSVTTERSTFYQLAARSSGASGSTSPPVLLNADGNGQVQGVALYRRTHTGRTSFLNTETGQRVREITTQSGYRVRPRQTGEYEVDGVKTDDSYETWGPISGKRQDTRNRRVTRNQTEVNAWSPGELPETTTVLAPLPISPGIPSSWTTTRPLPLSIFDEDPAILARYGANVRVVQSDFADSLDVLRRLLEQARRRDRSVMSTVDRRLSPIAWGDTVDVQEHAAGMSQARRTLCIGKVRNYSPGAFVERLDFEVGRFPL